MCQGALCWHLAAVSAAASVRLSGHVVPARGGTEQPRRAQRAACSVPDASHVMICVLMGWGNLLIVSPEDLEIIVRLARLLVEERRPLCAQTFRNTAFSASDRARA